MGASPASLEQVRGRARSYWHVDVIPWLVRGLQAMCWALVIFLVGHGPHSSVYFNLVALVAICLDRGTILFLKSRITYPRTGYVSPPPPFQATHDDFVLLRLNDDDRSPEPTPRPKVSLLTMVALMLAAYAGFLALESLIRLQWIAIAIASAGLLLALSGATRLLIYLRRTRKPAK